MDIDDIAKSILDDDNYCTYPSDLISKIVDDQLHKVLSKISSVMIRFRSPPYNEDPKLQKCFKTLDGALADIGDIMLKLKSKRDSHGQ